jgi:hypothetical protein
MENCNLIHYTHKELELNKLFLSPIIGRTNLAGLAHPDTRYIALYYNWYTMRKIILLYRPNHF